MNNWEEVLEELLVTYFDVSEPKKRVEQVKEYLDLCVTKTTKEDVLIPGYLSSYVASFYFIDIRRQKIYFCAEDEKTGACDDYQSHDLSNDDFFKVRFTEWPMWKPKAYLRIKDMRSYEKVKKGGI